MVKSEKFPANLRRPFVNAGNEVGGGNGNRKRRKL
jgi:hypothetical protein